MNGNKKLSSRFKLGKEEKKIKKDTVKKLQFAVKKDIETTPKNDFKAKNNEQSTVSNVSLSDIEQEFKQALMEKIDSIPVWFEYSQIRQKELIKSFVENKLGLEHIQISSIDKDILLDTLYSSITNFGAVQYLLDNSKVSDVMINGTKSVHIVIGGKVLNTEIKLTEKQLNFLINTLKNISGNSDFNHIQNIRTDKYIIKIIGANVCLNGTNITIKKIKEYDKKSIIKSGMMSAEIFDFLVSAVDMKKNIIISGGINSGKTVLTDVLLKSACAAKRTYLIEQNEQILTDYDMLVKFVTDKESEEYKNLVSEIQKLMPDYVITDLNSVEPNFSDLRGYIATLRANTAEFALKNLISLFMQDGTPEKFAKSKALTNFDYIVQLNRDSNGSVKLTSIVELSPAKTMQLSVKTIAKLADGDYVTQIPQPITSMRAEALISKNGNMTSRFKK